MKIKNKDSPLTELNQNIEFQGSMGNATCILAHRKREEQTFKEVCCE